jgi:hypothetical protein
VMAAAVFGVVEGYSRWGEVALANLGECSMDSLARGNFSLGRAERAMQPGG